MTSFALTMAEPSGAVGVTLEVTEAAESLLDSRLARRLITLELADVELPAISRTPSTAGTGPRPLRGSEVVFVRLLADSDVLTVELWAQGALTGERRIRVAGTEEHQARRVALACAELARHVREARLRERQRILSEHLVAEGIPSYSVSASLGAASSMRAIWLPGASSLLIGPRAAMWSRSVQGLGLEIDGGYYHATDSQGISFWAEVALRPSWTVASGQNVDVSIGAAAAAALVDVGKTSSISNAAESQQTWSARLALDGQLSFRLTPRTSLMFGPELGLLLRDVSLQPRAPGPRHLRGLWVGFGLGAEWYL